MEVTANEAMRFYPQTIDNKQYSADIILCVGPHKFFIITQWASLLSALPLAHGGLPTSGPLPWQLPLWGLTPDSRPLQVAVTGGSSPEYTQAPCPSTPSRSMYNFWKLRCSVLCLGFSSGSDG